MSRIIDVLEGNIPILCKIIVDDDIVKEGESKIEVKFRIVQQKLESNERRPGAMAKENRLKKMHNDIDKMKKSSKGETVDSKYCVRDISVYVSARHKEPNERRNCETYHNKG